MPKPGRGHVNFIFAIFHRQIFEANRFILRFRNRNIIRAVRQFGALIIAIFEILGDNDLALRPLREFHHRARHARRDHAFDFQGDKIDGQTRLFRRQRQYRRLGGQIQPKLLSISAMFADPGNFPRFAAGFAHEQFGFENAIRRGNDFLTVRGFQIAEIHGRRRQAFPLAIPHMPSDRHVVVQAIRGLPDFPGLDFDDAGLRLIAVFFDQHLIFAVRQALREIAARRALLGRKALFLKLVREGDRGVG